MSKITFISGATSGIGEACANRFAESGYNLIITGRREDRLKLIAENIKKKFKVKVKSLIFDVRDISAVNKSIEKIKGCEWENIDVLINNAGLSLGLNPINEGFVEDWDTMIDTNVKGLLYVSRAIMPIMIQKQSGHIINIGSIAGRDVYPKGNVYCASKHAVSAISEAMRIDLLEHGIKVTQISPGATETEFSIVRYKGDEEAAKKVYEGFIPLTGADIASIVFFAATLPNHVNINDLLVMPTAQAKATVIKRNI